MMKVKHTEISPAKINLFLRILKKRDSGYHDLRSGITLINLFDHVSVEQNDKFEVYYDGKFAPHNNLFEDCIITKFFSNFKIIKPNLKFTITKNIPIRSGLGSASSNLAAVLRILNKMSYDYSKIDFSKIGADVPFFMHNSDSLVRGIGDIVIKQSFPKYYFLLIKPVIDCSTQEMFSLIEKKIIDYENAEDINEITESDYGNDFEFYLKKKFQEINILLNYLSDLPNVVFTSLTGSGSCVFAAFDSKKDAETSKVIIRENFSHLWSKIVENNFI